MEQITILVINGPNMNLLGIRETQIYGEKKLNEIEDVIRSYAEGKEIKVLFYQSNHEGEIVDFIQDHLDQLNGIVINPAALSKTGYSILEAITSIDIPFVEIHMSNIYTREAWHAESIFSGYAVGQICGFKDKGYILALEGIVDYIIKYRMGRKR